MYEREFSLRRESAPSPAPPRRRPPRRRRRRRRAPLFSGVLAALVFVVLVAFFVRTDPGQSKSAGNLPAFQGAPEDGTVPVRAAEPKPKGAGTEDWRLVLVNPWNALPEGYEPDLTQLTGGHAVDERCYPDLQDMMDACRAAGNDPLICSSYRTWEKQEQLFENKVSRLEAQGYRGETARLEAAKTVAVPGTSEHQLGLALDIVDRSNQNLDESQEDTAVQQWLMKHSWEYGFILRFPTGKSDVTGIIYEPWHYRYVGKEAAKEIYDWGICLEEYLDAPEG